MDVTEELKRYNEGFKQDVTVYYNWSNPAKATFTVSYYPFGLGSGGASVHGYGATFEEAGAELLVLIKEREREVHDARLRKMALAIIDEANTDAKLRIAGFQQSFIIENHAAACQLAEELGRGPFSVKIEEGRPNAQ